MAIPFLRTGASRSVPTKRLIKKPNHQWICFPLWQFGCLFFFLFKTRNFASLRHRRFAFISFPLYLMYNIFFFSTQIYFSTGCIPLPKILILIIPNNIRLYLYPTYHFLFILQIFKILIYLRTKNYVICFF